MTTPTNTVSGHHDSLFNDLDGGTELANARVQRMHALVTAGTHSVVQAIQELAGMDGGGVSSSN